MTMVRVPVSLLLDPELTPSAKVLWMALRLRSPAGPARAASLRARSGLARPTVRDGLARLTTAGWYAAAAGEAIDRAPVGAQVTVPGDLLADCSVGALGKVLYGVLQETPQFRCPTGQFTYTGLGGLSGTSRNSVKLAVGDLVHAGWLQIRQLHQHAPVRFTLADPGVARGEAEVARARWRLEEAPFLGEGLMREYLSLLIASDDYEDNATPGFLVNPFTEERLELDRYYPTGVAFEFASPGASDSRSSARRT